MVMGFGVVEKSSGRLAYKIKNGKTIKKKKKNERKRKGLMASLSEGPLF
jgi:hypothetical protein